MESFSYWKKQGKTALFKEVDTLPPEQRRFAGKMLIIGGNKGAFFAVANAMTAANKAGIGEVRAIMPNSLRSKIPNSPDVYFAESEISGGFGKSALIDIMHQMDWADIVVVIGDLGKNAETAVLMADVIKHCAKPLYITRDAVDVVVPDVMNWVMRDEETAVFLTIPQLQKMLRTLYYPKVITLSMPMNQLVETLHKFTITYDTTIATMHNNMLVVAQGGEVITMALADTKWTPITLWNSGIIVNMATLALWNQSIPRYKTATTALICE